eukprot:7749094-Pyramimonas_sp.AAC.1
MVIKVPGGASPVAHIVRPVAAGVVEVVLEVVISPAAPLGAPCGCRSERARWSRAPSLAAGAAARSASAPPPRSGSQ